MSKEKVEMQKLTAQADKLPKVQKQVEELQQANSALKRSDAERTTLLKSTQDKLEGTDDELRATQNQLMTAASKMKKAMQDEDKENARVKQLYQTLKRNKAQLEIDAQELTMAKHQLKTTEEEKNVLAKELQVTESKLAQKARDKKDLEVANAEIVKLNLKIASKDKEEEAFTKALKEAAERTQEFNTVKAKVAEAAAEQKELVDQLAAAKQQEKDELAAAAAKEQEMRTQIAAAYQREKDLHSKNDKLADDLKKKDKEVHAAWEEEAKIKANTLTDALNAEQEPVGPSQPGTDEDLLVSGSVLSRNQ